MPNMNSSQILTVEQVEELNPSPTPSRSLSTLPTLPSPMLPRSPKESGNSSA